MRLERLETHVRLVERTRAANTLCLVLTAALVLVLVSADALVNVLWAHALQARRRE